MSERIVGLFTEFLQSRIGAQDDQRPPQRIDARGDDHFNIGVPYPDDVDPDALKQAQQALHQVDDEINQQGGTPTPEQTQRRLNVIAKLKELQYSYIDPAKVAVPRKPTDPNDVV